MYNQNLLDFMHMGITVTNKTLSSFVFCFKWITQPTYEPLAHTAFIVQLSTEQMIDS